MKIQNEKFYHLINHGPCVLVTSGDAKTYNIATIAWLTPVNDEPPIVAVAISEGAYTSELILKTKSFVINIVSDKHLATLKICGSVSGRKTDKFKKANLTPVKSFSIDTPYVKEAIGHIECKLKENHRYDGVILFIGDVVFVEIGEDYYDKFLIPEKARTPHHLGGGYFVISDKRIEI